MSDGEIEETRDFWNRVADDWRIQVGDDGDGNRVLKTDGVAVLVFSHPGFPQDRATVSETGEEIGYGWSFSYFEPRRCTSPPWAHFTSEFIWFHRPLADYWKAFMVAGFVVVDFEEPRITADRYHLAKTERGLKNSQTRPLSVLTSGVSLQQHKKR